MTENEPAASQSDKNQERAMPRRVVCLFCGAHTSIPADQRRNGGELSSDYHPWNIRCCVCGKEATYQAHEVIEAQETSRPYGLRVRVAGLN
jgi:hypothetical protein